MAHRGRYAIERFDRELRTSTTIEFTPKWFRSNSGFPGGSRFEEPEPVISNVAQAQDGTLWVIIAVAAANWTPPAPGTEREVSIAATARHRDYILEAVDPIARRRVASRRFSNPIFFGKGDGLLYEKYEGAFGRTALNAYKPQLTNGEGR